MLGEPHMVRLMYGFRGPKWPIPGWDFAGTIDAVGPGVTAWRPGDRVVGQARGTFAQYAVADADALVRLPVEVPFTTAAALPVSATTASEAVRIAGVGEGDRVAVLGAGGGVGCFAVQLAVRAGAEVTGVCSGAKAGFVRGLGARHVIDHTRHDILDDDRRWDVILDLAGNRPVGRLRRLLTRDGRLLVIGGEPRRPEVIGVRRMLQATLTSWFVPQEMQGFVADMSAEVLGELVALVASGELRVPVDRVFEFEDAVAAIQYVRDGRASGKVVVRVRADEPA